MNENPGEYSKEIDRSIDDDTNGEPDIVEANIYTIMILNFSFRESDSR